MSSAPTKDANHLRATNQCWHGWLTFFVLFAGVAIASGQTDQVRCREVVEAFTRDLDGGSAAPPDWKHASMGEIRETRRGGPTSWYAGSMLRDASNSGYAVLAGQGEHLGVIMYSGSRLPEAVASTLSLSTGYVAPPAPRDFLLPKRRAAMIESVDVIAAYTISPRLTTSAVASCLASILVGWASLGDDWALPILASDRSTYAVLLQSHLGVSEARMETLMLHHTREAGDRYERYSQDRDRLLEQWRLKKPLELKGPMADQLGEALRARLSQSYVIKEGRKAFDVLSPMTKAYLLDRITPYERCMLLNIEQNDANSCFQGTRASASAEANLCVSTGAHLAFLLDHLYLEDADSVEAGIREFGLSRGFDVTCQQKPVSRLTGQDLPCLLLGPDDEAMVLRAISGEASAGWALVMIPSTVVSKRVGPEDKLPAVVSRNPISVPDLPPTTSPEEEERREALRQVLAASSKGVYLYDREVILPASLTYGAHVVAITALEENWDGLVISVWKLADNWELGPEE